MNGCPQYNEKTLPEKVREKFRRDLIHVEQIHMDQIENTFKGRTDFDRQNILNKFKKSATNFDINEKSVQDSLNFIAQQCKYRTEDLNKLTEKIMSF